VGLRNRKEGGQGTRHRSQKAAPPPPLQHVPVRAPCNSGKSWVHPLCNSSKSCGCVREAYLWSWKYARAVVKADNQAHNWLTHGVLDIWLSFTAAAVSVRS
jgi:hypothetical protein